MSDSPNIIVIGAGAAGLMAAIHAAAGGQRVMLLERTTDGGRKILISGGGRCNVLPSALDPSRYVTASSPNTMRNLLRSWPLEEQRRFFESRLQLPLALEVETGKLFPVSGKARMVRDALVAAARSNGVQLVTDAHVLEVRPGGRGWRVRLASGDELEAQSLIVATGGLSVPQTGSDGWGLQALAALGHTINRTFPALTPLTSSPPPFADLAGVSFPVTLRATSSTESVTTTGGFLFTHRGYSGPSVLDVSHVLVRARQEQRSGTVRVQWTHDLAWWAAQLGSSAQMISSVLRRELPIRLADRLLREAGVDGETILAQLQRDGRNRLLAALTRFELPVTGDEGYKKAEVTGGGVALGEVNPKTMESRLHPGLFLCGELLDAFGPIGGYNFVWAWATGRLAGLGAAERVPPS